MAYSQAIEDLKKDLFRLHPENEKFYNLIEGLKSIDSSRALTSNKGTSFSQPIIKLVFDRNSSATEQVLFALKYLGVLAKSSDIMDAIREFDPAFDKILSTPFYKLKEAGTIAIYNPTITDSNPEGSNHSVYYGLKEWFNGKNDPKEEYMDQKLKDLIEIL